MVGVSESRDDKDQEAKASGLLGFGSRRRRECDSLAFVLRIGILFMDYCETLVSTSAEQMDSWP